MTDLPHAPARPLLRDDFPRPLRTVAGLAVAPVDGGLRAAAVLLDGDGDALLDRAVAHLPGAEAGDEGLALDALLAALAQLARAPDLAFVHGHGIAHPQRRGLAVRFGLASGLPTVGVATEALAGAARMALHDMRGAFTPLRDGAEQIGWLLRSRIGAPPLVVSPGHRVALPSAPELAMRHIAGDRLPEPVRLALRLAQAGAPATGDERPASRSRPLHPDAG